MRRLLCLLPILLLFAGLAPDALPNTAELDLPQQGASSVPDDSETMLRTFGTLITWFLILCAVGMLLLLVMVGLLLWKAKQLVANAVRSDPVALAKTIERLRRKYPDLDDQALCKKVIARQAHRAGWVGFVTGLGGLPTLPLALPIDIALTIRTQANMVHMLRLIQRLDEEEVPEAGLWLATAGGLELATAGSTALREVVVKTISKSLLKFLPLIGGVIGFGLNWASTQAMGRVGLQWLASDQADVDPTKVVQPKRLETSGNADSGNEGSEDSNGGSAGKSTASESAR